MNSKGKLFIISGPSGVGKSTIRERIINTHNNFWYSISMTTRTPREGEINEKDYYFVTKKEFIKNIKEDNFFEYAEVYKDVKKDYELEYKRYEIQKCDALAHNPGKLDKRIKYLYKSKKMFY